jgi:hypothetical protein
MSKILYVGLETSKLFMRAAIVCDCATVAVMLDDLSHEYIWGKTSFVF